MKVSETTGKTTNGTTKVRGKQQNGGQNGSGSAHQSMSSRSCKATSAELNSKAADVKDARKSSNGSSSSSSTQKKEFGDSSKRCISSESKKPWIPCARRPSKPKPLPDVELSLINSKNACKKFPKPSTPVDGEKSKAKANLSKSNSISNDINDNGSSVFERLTANNGSLPTSLSSSMERRARSVLKRQFALDKANGTNLKESNSEESLNSINSVSQLLKIERSAFAMKQRQGHELRDNQEEVLLTGVKLIAARLEAKNTNNLMASRYGAKNNGIQGNGLVTNNRISDGGDNEKNAQNFITSHPERTKHFHQADNLQKISNEEKNSIVSSSAEPKERNKLAAEEILAKSQTAVIQQSEASAAVLLQAAAEAMSSSLRRKKTNPNKTNNLISSTSLPVTRSTSSPERKQVDNLKSTSRSRSTSPVKCPSSSSPKEGVNIKRKSSIEANNNKTPKPLNSSRSSSINRKTTKVNSPTEATTNPLIKQSNPIKDKKGESTPLKSGRITNKSHLIKADTKVENDSGQGHTNDRNSTERLSRRRSRRSDEGEINRVKSYARPTIASQASNNKTVIESSLSRETSRTRNSKRVIRPEPIKRGKDEICKELNPKSIVPSKHSSSEDVLDYSLSSLSTSSVASTPSTSWRSRQEQLEKGVIPSIIMSEYVDNIGSGKESGKNKSLFSPLKFIEPLEPTCDIEEGSSLELKVRVKGAEGVIWVKENKVIPNAPPDFQYFQKSNDLYGLRIADVFLEDAGLYRCEAYAGNSEISCWCEVDVIETGGNTDDEISWDDLDISEEVKKKPLVVPLIVTSQAEQERKSANSSPSSETGQSKESPVRTAPVRKTVKIDRDAGDCDQLILARRSLRKLSSNESAISNKSQFVNTTMKKSQSASEAPIKQGKDECAQAVQEKVTLFASESAVSKIPEEISSPVEKQTMEKPIPVATSAPVENATEKSDKEVQESTETSQSQDDSRHEKRKLMNQLSSASDESIHLKEHQSADEGALSNEETSGTSISFIDGKSNDGINDEGNVISESPAYSPFSEQNGRSSSVDSAIGFLGRPLFSDGKFPPRILVGPSNVIALYGEVVHLRVKVQNYGIPKTSVNWFKFINGTYKKIESSSAANAANEQLSQEETHASVSKCGASLSTLTLTHVNYDDCGRYRVKVQNLLGMDSHDLLLTVEGPPEPPSTPPKVKYDEKSKTILIQWSSCPYDGGSKITGYYVEASIVQSSKTAINQEEDNWQLLTPQSYSWLCYTLTEPKRGSTYRFRVFGENIYGKGKPTEPSLTLLVPVLMEGRRAGSSDALLWSLKSLSTEETSSLRADSNRNNIVHECENETATVEESVSSQEEEEPVEYNSVSLRHESFYNIYDKLDELGKGRFGVVFEVMKKETKKSYAGKFVKCIKAKDKERVQLEVQIMNDLKYHPKLICLIDAFEMAREIVIVTQQINGGELFERVVADDFTLTEGDCITFLRQICDGVGYIHEKKIMHLDLKPENILCTSKNSNSIKLIDFGLAQYYNPDDPIRVLFGTAEFVSPEIINYETIAPSTDNWSVGVITYILLSGLSPFMGDNDNETFSNITRAEFDFDDEAFEQISDEAKDFISNLIVKRPEKRMTALECLNHRWLKRESDDEIKKVILPTDKLKRFLVRRKWQKTGNAIRALGRITTLYSSRRSSSTSSTTGSMSVSSPGSQSQVPSSRSGSLVTQESTDDNVFYQHPNHHPQTNRQDSACNNNTTFNNNVNHQKLKQSQFLAKGSPLISSGIEPTNRSKYTDSCGRSDSGVCDVGLFSSSSLSYE